MVSGGDAALLIDWENFKYSLQNGPNNVPVFGRNSYMDPSINALREHTERYGRIVIARAYADWQDGHHQGDATALYASGIEPIYVPTLRSGQRVKNSVDVKLSTDCVEFCHRLPAIGTYILVTGDSDFIHVVNALRPYGKQVIIIAVSWTTSTRLAERVDEVVYYDRDIVPAPETVPVEPITPAPAVAAAVEAAEQSPQSGALAAVAERLMIYLEVDADQRDDLARILDAILEIVREYRSEQRPLLLSQLGMELSRKVSGHSFAMIAKGRLKQLATTLEAHGLIRVQGQGLVDWLYLPDETIPAAARIDEAETAFGEPAMTDDFVDLPAADRREVVAAIRDLRGQPGISFLTFNRVSEVVTRTRIGVRLGWNVRRFVNGMVESNVLMTDEEQTWFDPVSGNTGLFKSLRLNVTHPCVSDVL